MTKEKLALTKTLADKAYLNFQSNLYDMGVFVARSEYVYDKEAKSLKKQAQKTAGKLTQNSRLLNKLADKEEVTKVEERALEKLVEKEAVLSDRELDIIFAEKSFRDAYGEKIRVLSFIYIVAIYDAYVEDITTALNNIDSKPITKRSMSDTDFLSKRFNVNIINAGLPDIVEIRACRNIHAHNMGLVDERYLQNVKDSKLTVDSYKPITQDYLKQSIGLISKLGKVIHKQIQSEYLTR
jgi:hypothetical protein